MKPKKKHRLLWGILFCLPLAFIAYFVFTFTSGTLSVGSVNGVHITLPGGDTYSFEDEASIELYVGAVLDASPLNEPLRDLENERPAVVAFDRGDRTIEYRLYAELNASGCVLLSPEGRYSVINGDTAKALLSGEESAYLYSARFLPTLSVVSGNQNADVAPLSYTWHYTNAEGEVIAYTDAPLYDESSLPSICSVWENALHFSLEPSRLLVTYYDANGMAIAGASIESLIFGTDTVFTVEIEAQWEESDTSNCYGEATYRFPVLYDIPATVTLPVNEARPGEVWAYTVQNLNDGQSLLLDTALHTASPYLYRDGDRICALLPIAADNEAGTYTLNFRSGDVTSPIGLKIGEADTETVTLDVSADRFDALTDEALEECMAALRSIPQADDGRIGLHTGTPFEAPVSGTALAGFGSSLTLRSGTDSRVLAFEGSIYRAAGADVKSCAGGTVVFSGELPLLGQTVAVDHGLGVVSYYGCLSSGTKRVGDTVSAGEILAAADDTLYFAVSVGGVFVSPDFLLEHGIG